MTETTITQGEIAAEAGAEGGGWTDIHKRPRNDDRGLIIQIHPPENAEVAATFLKQLIETFVAPATKDIIKSGSTLSIAMAVGAGKFACAHIGDSPIYVLAQHETTKEVRFIPAVVPHNNLGDICRKIQGEDTPNSSLRADEILETYSERARQWLEANNHRFTGNFSPEQRAKIITKNLGNAHNRPDDELTCAHTPEISIIDAQAHCPEGFVPKAILVCSDGVEKGLAPTAKLEETQYSGISLVLQSMLERRIPPPSTIAEIVVDQAKGAEDNRDNITATVMPIDALAGNIIAVADGNYQTAKVAETAVQCIREQCLQRLRPNPNLVELMGTETTRKAPTAPDQNLSERPKPGGGNVIR